MDSSPLRLIAVLAVALVSSPSRLIHAMPFDCELNTTHLDLSGLELSHVKLGPSCANLVEINLSDNALGTIEYDAFQHTPLLTYLDISSAGLTKLEPGTFSMLENLEYLNLCCNPINLLGLNLFGSISDLLFLNLQGTHITTIPEKVLQKFPYLKINMTCFPSPQYFESLSDKSLSSKVFYAPPQPELCSLPPDIVSAGSTCPLSPDDGSSSDFLSTGTLIAICVVSAACAIIAVCVAICIWRSTRFSGHAKSLKFVRKSEDGQTSQEMMLSTDGAAIGMPVYTEEPAKGSTAVQLEDDDPVQNLK